jgi:hypothetical protein
MVGIIKYINCFILGHQYEPIIGCKLSYISACSKDPMARASKLCKCKRCGQKAIKEI